MRKYCTHEEFIRVWQKAKCVKDVCRAFDMPYGSATTRASFLRERGVPLKHFVGAVNDYGELAKLAKETADE